MDTTNRLTKLQQQRNALDRKIRLEETRLRIQERKADTRRKIIAGAIVLTHAACREAFKDILYPLLEKFTEAKDKYLFPEIFTPEQIAQATIEAQQLRQQHKVASATHNAQDISAPPAAPDRPRSRQRRAP